jgi:hypothetical protein
VGPAKAQIDLDPYNIHHPRHWTRRVAGRFHGAFEDESLGNGLTELNNDLIRPEAEQRSAFERSASRLFLSCSIQANGAQKLGCF